MEMTDYLNYSKNKKSPFFGFDIVKDVLDGTFDIPPFREDHWTKYSDEHWINIISNKYDFPSQGWKIHISADVSDAQNLLFDVAQFLIDQNISFKYVPSLRTLLNKNVKYANRGASGKFITVYPKDTEQFIHLLDQLKNITDAYELGPYILNDQQWKESNVFFRYGGLKKVVKLVDGKEVLAIKTPDGELIEDQRVPYYHLPDFVEEPEMIQSQNTYPAEDEFFKLNEFTILEAIHHSNGGGVYIAEKNGQKIILKEGRSKSGIDSTRTDAFQRNKNEFYNLDRLKDVDTVINVYEYFTAWRHNYFTEEFHEGRNLQAFISQEFPFTTSIQEKNNAYVEKCDIILQQLVSTIDQIHSKGVAMGDLSLTNIMIDDQTLKIKLIDFEAAKTPDKKFIAAVATPGLFSNEAQTFREADWFAVYRISRLLFLPIPNVVDISPQLAHIHDEAIQNKFGERARKILQDIESRVAKYTNLQPKSSGIESKLNIPVRELNSKSIEETMSGLQKGILNNLKVDNIGLTEGKVRQYLERDNIYKHNIAYGSFGVLMSLIRSDRTLIPTIKIKYSNWFEIIVPYVENYSKNTWSKIGLYDGYSGIITVLYELGYKERALNILDQLIKRCSYEQIEAIEDISIESGLSGVGLLLLSFYDILKDEKILNCVDHIYNRIIRLYSLKEETPFEDLETPINYGLLTGWSGAALFLSKYNDLLDNRNTEIAYKILDDSFNAALESEEVDELYILKHDLEIRKAIPYLREGSAGLNLAMLEFKKDNPNYLNESRERILKRFKKSHEFYCSATAGLMDGYAGFLSVAQANDILNSTTSNSKEVILSGLNNFLVRNGTEELLSPGAFNLKCSMDLYTGSAGVLLTLADLKKDKWGSFLPIPDSGVNLFNSTPVRRSLKSAIFI